MLGRLQGTARHGLSRAVPQAAATLSGSSQSFAGDEPSLGRVLSRSAEGRQRFAERKSRHWLPSPVRGAVPPGSADEHSWLPAPRYRGAAAAAEPAVPASAAASLRSASDSAQEPPPPVWTRKPRPAAFSTFASPFEGLAAAMLRCDPGASPEAQALLARAAALRDSRLLNRLLKDLGDEALGGEGDAAAASAAGLRRRPPGGRTSAGFAAHAAMLAQRQTPRHAPGSLQRARRGCQWGLAVFDALRDAPPLVPGSAERLLNVHVCVSLISLLGRHGQWVSARAVFDWLRSSGQEVNTFAYSALVSAYEKGDQFAAAVALLADMDAAGVAPNSITLCALTVAAARGGSFADLRRLYERMAADGIQPDTVTCNTVLAICARSEHHARAEMVTWVYHCMAKAGLVPTIVTFNVLIFACERGANWKRALDCYDLLRAAQLQPDLVTFNSLISVCSKGAQWAAAEEVFKRMREEGLQPTTISYNALISACEKGAALERALFWFEDMKRNGVAPDAISYNALISTCEKAGRWDTAMAIFDAMRAGPVRPTTVTFSALIAALEKGGEWERALAAFEQMPALGCTPNHITFNSLVSACAAGSQWGAALEVYHRMLRSETVPDRATFNPLIGVLWSCGQFTRAQELLREALDDGVYGEPFADVPAAASVDLHSLSAGAAQACVVLWLRHVRERYFTPSVTAEPPPPQFQIITGWGKHSRRHGLSEVKAAISEALHAAGSPFRAHRSNFGMLAADATELAPWLKAYDERALHVVGAGDATSAARAASAREKHSAAVPAAAPSSFATLA